MEILKAEWLIALMVVLMAERSVWLQALIVVALKVLMMAALKAAKMADLMADRMAVESEWNKAHEKVAKLVGKLVG